MTKLLLLLLALAGILFENTVQAKEGFYRPDQLGSAEGLLERARGATVLFEGENDDGSFTPFANGFFVSSDGIILTNHHVGTNCGGRAPNDEYRNLSRPWDFEPGHGYPCREFRARVFPNTSKERVLDLELISRPNQAVLDRGGDFILLHAIDYHPETFVRLAKTRDFPMGTSFFVAGYPPETTRGDSSVLIRAGAYSDIAERGDYRIAFGKTVKAPADYLNASNPAPYFVGDADGAPGTSGSLVLTPQGNFLGYVQGAADHRALGDSPDCRRDGRAAGSTEFYCGGLINYLRATWVIDQMTVLFPKTMGRLDAEKINPLNH